MEFSLADRLNKLPPYLFAEMRRKIVAAKEAGISVINLGIGDPDMPTPDPIVDELVRSVTDRDDGNRHRYGCDCPYGGFPSAVREYYQRRFGVRLEPDEVVTTSGSKDAIVQLCLGLMNPGDIGITPGPGYPTYNIGHTFASGSSFFLPLLKQNGFLPDLQSIPLEVARLAKILWINYPNNPTTATATMEFFREVVEFGRHHNILIAHDLAYGENCYDGYRAPSILEVDGAKEVAVEFLSLSKGFNMTGWRSGAVVGNAKAVAAVRLVKENSDNGTFRPVQFAAATALVKAEQIVPDVTTVYARRRDMVVQALKRAGCPVVPPKATIYVWAPVPERYSGSSVAFANDLFERSRVVVTPGLGYGQWGEGFVRISLTYPDAVIAEAMSRIAELL